MKTMPLWAVAEARPSNVDKKSKPGEAPVRLVNYTDVYYNQTIHPEMDLMEASASDEHIERFGVQAGDLIITKDSETPDDIGIPAIVGESAADMVCAYHLSLLRLDMAKAVPKFLYWCLESGTTKAHWLTSSFGVTRYSIQSGAVARLPIPDLDVDAQKRIADYLDRETGEIDAMLGKMDELKETLEARRKGITDRLLEQQFTNDMTPIWSVLTPTKEQQHPTEEVLSVYRDFGVILKSSRSDNHNRTPKDLSAYQLVRPGDLVINKMKAWQGSLGVSKYRGIVSPDYQVARPTRPVVPEYLHAILRSARMIPHYRVRSTGVRPSQWRLYWEDFADLMIPVPPLDEQRRIADQLDESTTKLDAMLAKAAELKSLLIERRAALITDVVTGKKKIA